MYKRQVLVAVIFLSYNILLGAVDKSTGQTKEIFIEEGSSLSGITTVLKENDLIKNETAFKIYVKISGKSNDLKAG